EPEAESALPSPAAANTNGNGKASANGGFPEPAASDQSKTGPVPVVKSLDGETTLPKSAAQPTATTRRVESPPVSPGS
ncbi:hypothetical protein LTS18_004638, partial [Coniosporium uncinatum]